MKIKKTLCILLLIITCSIAKTQTLSGVFKNNGSSTGSYYTDVKWEVSYSFEEDNGAVYIKFYNPKISVPNYSKYNFYGNVYTLGDIGKSSWPQSNQLPYAMQVKVNVSDGTKNYDVYGSCDADGTCDRAIIAHIANIKNFSIGKMRVPAGAGSFHANLGGEPKTEELLTNIVNKQSHNKTSSFGDVATTSSETNGEVATSSSRYTSTYTKKDQATEILVEATPIVTELVNQWNANYEKKMARQQAEYDEGMKNRREEQTKFNEARFTAEYLPLMDDANLGDRDARMILYFASEALHCECMVPQREEWFVKVLKNSDPEAILEYARVKWNKPENGGFVKVKDIVEESAKLGNIDAMIVMGSWYNVISQGNDPVLAMRYFSMAADKGSPVAMSELGKIYMYGNTYRSDRHYKGGYVIYDIGLDFQKALYWFEKSLQPDYVESAYSRSVYINDVRTYDQASSYFDCSSYLELYNCYSKGKGVAKNKKKAKEYMSKYDNFINENYTYKKKFYRNNQMRII